MADLRAISPMYIYPPLASSQSSSTMLIGFNPKDIPPPSTSSSSYNPGTSPSLIRRIIDFSHGHNITSLSNSDVQMIQNNLKDNLAQVTSTLTKLTKINDIYRDVLKRLNDNNITLNEFINEISRNINKTSKNKKNNNNIVNDIATLTSNMLGIGPMSQSLVGGVDSPFSSQSDLDDLRQLSPQLLLYRDNILSSLEHLIVQFGHKIIELDKQRKANNDKIMNNIHHNNSIGTDTTKLRSNNTNIQQPPIHFGLDLVGNNNNDIIKQQQHQAKKQRYNTNTYNSLRHRRGDDMIITDNNHNGLHDDHNNDTNINKNMTSSSSLDDYGITYTQLEQDKATLSSIDDEELALAIQSEQSVNTILNLVSQFSQHIKIQSEQIQNIYDNVCESTINIEEGNIQLDDALTKGRFGVWFYIYTFLIAAVILLIFDFILN